jgi:hypothetical protein
MRRREGGRPRLGSPWWPMVAAAAGHHSEESETRAEYG